MAKRWYIVHTKTNQEKKVKSSLERLIEQGESNILQVIVPTEEVAEIIRGQRKVRPREFFPGYILVEMECNEETWHKVRTTANVLGILGEGNNPTPLPEEEIQDLLNVLEEKKKKPSSKVEFEKGEHVEIKEGPFANFSGVVEEIDSEKERLKVGIFIFGRVTKVELEYWQVEKI